MNLRFRDRRLNRRTWRHIWLLMAVFVISLIFFYLIFNIHRKPGTTEMSKPTLPVITATYGDEQVGMLHGYRTKMDGCYMRGAILPLGDQKEIPFTIHTYGSSVTGLSYELMTTDTEKKIASGKAGSLSGSSDSVSGQLKLDGKLEDDTEYLLVMKLAMEEGDPVYYYTRVMKPEESHEEECFAFAKMFHDTALSDDYMNLAMYLNSNTPDAPAATAIVTSQDTASLYKVTLDSTIEQVGYGAFDGKVVGRPQISFTDINHQYTTIEYDYLMSREDAGKHTQYYQVHEYMRARYTPNRMYMNDYERTMTQIVSDGGTSISEDKLNLGPGDPKLSYLSNETGTIVSFVSAGDLLEYDPSDRRMKRIFSFRDDDVSDPRVNIPDHGIKILNMDETGTMNFVVYGYMNSGDHEGQVGINLYHYDSVTGVCEEKAFVQTTNSYQILNAAFSDLLYMSGDHSFYLMVSGTLMKINLSNSETTEVMRGLALSQYAASRSGRYLAYTGDGVTHSVIHILDLETGKKSSVKAEAGTKLRLIDFMDDDLVYGVVRDSDIATDGAGTQISPMYQLKIISTATRKNLMTYQKDGLFITDANPDGSTLHLVRMSKSGDIYVAAPEDSIKNSYGETNKAVTVGLTSDDLTGTAVQITMVNPNSEETPSKALAVAAVPLSDAPERATVLADASSQENQYFVYVGSRVVLATDSPSDAISRANDEMGIVVDNSQRYIWKRARVNYINALTGFEVNDSDKDANTSTQCVSAILAREGKHVSAASEAAQKKTPVEILSAHMKKAVVLDLTGCDLTETFYYISHGNPVYALTGDGQAVLVVGYSSNAVRIYDPAVGGTRSVEIEDVQSKFEAAGNVFISYID